MAEDWSLEEVAATVADYFDMWRLELGSKSFNKAERNRALQAKLRNRSKGAIEFKHANISAVLIELSYPYIDGYKPRSNYQELLRDEVIAYIEANRDIPAIAAAAVSAAVQSPEPEADWQAILVPPPKREEPKKVYERRSPRRLPRVANYLEREARNQSLGAAGEEFALNAERIRLWTAGARRLAERIEHVSRTRGDGLGYDILSYETSGRERLIEVKTTRYGIMTPFFVTRNEVAVAKDALEAYHVYRVFKYEESPKLFVLSGPLESAVVLEPEIFRATLP